MAILPSGCWAADRMIVDWVGVSFCRVIMVIASRMFAAEDRQQLIERGIHLTQVANVAPVDGIRIVAEVLIGQLLQPCQFGVDGCGAGKGRH